MHQTDSPVSGEQTAPDIDSIRSAASIHGIAMSEPEAELVSEGLDKARSALQALRSRSYDPTAGGLDVARSDAWLRNYPTKPRPWLGKTWPGES